MYVAAERVSDAIGMACPANGVAVADGARSELSTRGGMRPADEGAKMLGPAFERLDAILGRALPQAQARFGAEASADSFRGLYVSAAQATASLDGPPGVPLLNGPVLTGADAPCWEQVASEHAGWRWLRDGYGLTDQELDVVLLGLAPEADLRYERLYGYLQDDVGRRRPTVNLALDLVTTTAEEKLAARALFRADAPLLSQHVIRLVPDPRSAEPPVLAHIIVPDQQVVDVLLLQGGLGRGLAGHCRLSRPPPGRWADVPLPAGDRESLLAAVAAAWPSRPLWLHFHGPGGSGRLATAQALAGELRAPLLVLDLSRDVRGGDVEDVLFHACREASLQCAVLYLDSLDAWPETDGARALLARRLAGHHGVAIMAGSKPWAPLGGPPLGVMEVSFVRPGFEVRRRMWQRCLTEAGVTAPTELVGALAGRFRFGPGQIAEAVATAACAAHSRAVSGTDGPGRGPPAEPTPAELFAAARGQTGHLLATLARRMEPAYAWDDLVLPADATAQLHELCQRVTLRQRVWQDWGFARKFAHGRGTTALFTGPSGTGKTMAAEVISRELGLDLFTIDLSAVISKYIGETEKNLERIFAAAGDADAILMFDEADALFGKRSEVRDSHDRYANIEISYLLQRMEQYDGVAILATNLRQHLDEAFTRRLQFIIDFPFPGAPERRRIWQTCLPDDAPLEDGIDLEQLSRDFKLSGGNIRNVVLRAAFLAAAQDAPIGPSHLLRAVRREHHKMGKVVPGVEPGTRQEQDEGQPDVPGP
jgi:SpoVK/Ycf46/Vps4 family AAA+-type ATPase